METESEPMRTSLQHGLSRKQLIKLDFSMFARNTFSMPLRFMRNSPLALILLILNACSGMVDVPSANFNSRIDYLVIHATSENFEQSLRLLTQPSENSVSSHYLIPTHDDASYPRNRLQIYRLVPEQVWEYTVRVNKGQKHKWQEKRLFIDSWIHSFVHAIVRSFTHSSIHSFIQLWMHAFINIFSIDQSINRTREWEGVTCWIKYPGSLIALIAKKQPIATTADHTVFPAYVGNTVWYTW